MSKELLKALTDVLDDLKLRRNLSEDDALNISDSVLIRAENAIKNYLAQPEHIPDVGNMVEQEPVAHCLLIPVNGNELVLQVGIAWVDKPIAGALYTSPPNREPLGLEEINECMENSASFGFNGDVYIADGDNAFENFARAIEKAHGIGE